MVEMFNNEFETLIDVILGKTLENVLEKAEDYIEPFKLRGLMINAIKHVANNNKENIAINKSYKRKIKKFDVNLIAPNLTIESLSKNIRPELEKYINLKNERQREKFWEDVCLQYKLDSAEYIKLSHVDDDVHQGFKEMKYGFKEMKYRDCMESPLHFIDELNDSIQYSYIHLVLADNDKEFFENLGDEINANTEYIEFGVSESSYVGIPEVYYTFEEPVLQRDLKKKLVVINEKCRDEGYGIVSIRSNK